MTSSTMEPLLTLQTKQISAEDNDNDYSNGNEAQMTYFRYSPADKFSSVQYDFI